MQLEPELKKKLTAILLARNHAEWEVLHNGHPTAVSLGNTLINVCDSYLLTLYKTYGSPVLEFVNEYQTKKET